MLLTTNVQDRRPVFAHPAHAREAVETLYRIRTWHPFYLFGFVMMPDHCHLLVLVESPLEISDIMRTFKIAVTRNIGVGPLWQSRFHCELTRNSREALRYIHENPVRAGLCEEPSEYPWSSAHQQWVVDDLG